MPAVPSIGVAGGPNPAPFEGTANDGTNEFWSMPGCTGLVSTGTSILTANQIRYDPMLVTAPMTIDRIGCELTTAGAAGKFIRIGLYNADANWQPTSLVVDGGNLLADTVAPAILTATVAVTLPPGRYLRAFNTDGAPTLRRWLQNFPGVGSAILLTGGTTPGIQALFKSAVNFSALPSTGDTWNAATASGGGGYLFQTFVRISSP